MLEHWLGNVAAPAGSEQRDHHYQERVVGPHVRQVSATYALISTCPRRELNFFQRLAASVSAQTTLPEAWLIVDNGSAMEPWSWRRSWQSSIRGSEFWSVPAMQQRVRATVSARSTQESRPSSASQTIVKLDADVSMSRIILPVCSTSFRPTRRLASRAASASSASTGSGRRCIRRLAMSEERYVRIGVNASKRCCRYLRRWVGTVSTRSRPNSEDGRRGPWLGFRSTTTGSSVSGDGDERSDGAQGAARTTWVIASRTSSYAPVSTRAMTLRRSRWSRVI